MERRTGRKRVYEGWIGRGCNTEGTGCTKPRRGAGVKGGKIETVDGGGLRITAATMRSSKVQDATMDEMGKGKGRMIAVGRVADGVHFPLCSKHA